METKFSKGPWLIASGNFVYSLNDKGCNQFCFLVQGNGARGAGTVEIDANASLIACAPEMYQELSDLVGEFHCECGHPRCGREETKRSIEALLAKARGES